MCTSNFTSNLAFSGEIKLFVRRWKCIFSLKIYLRNPRIFSEYNYYIWFVWKINSVSGTYASRLMTQGHKFSSNSGEQMAPGAFRYAAVFDWLVVYSHSMYGCAVCRDLCASSHCFCWTVCSCLSLNKQHLALELSTDIKLTLRRMDDPTALSRSFAFEALRC